MLNNAHDIKPGSLIFYTRKFNIFSNIVTFITGFKYTNIALYLGNNEVLEMTFYDHFLKKTSKVSFSNYIDNPRILGEVVTFLKDPVDIKWFIARVKKLLRSGNSFLNAIQIALAGLEIEIKKRNNKITLKEIFKRVCKK